jgi:hypothetical protein
VRLFVDLKTRNLKAAHHVIATEYVGKNAADLSALENQNAAEGIRETNGSD